MKEFISHSEANTIEIAHAFSKTLGPREILFLEGRLGAGKSVFARTLIRSLTGDAGLTVPSPTFTLLQIYETPGGPIWHYDLYRLKDPDEMEELSWNEALAEGIVLIEWPEKLQHLKPAGRMISLETISGDLNVRKIRIEE